MASLSYSGLAAEFLNGGAKAGAIRGPMDALDERMFASTAMFIRISSNCRKVRFDGERPMGAERPKAASCARLRDESGATASMPDTAAWERLARFFAEAQMREIMDAAALVLSRGLIGATRQLPARASGRGVIRELAGRLGRSSSISTV